jgi:hypothetical protein
MTMDRDLQELKEYYEEFTDGVFEALDPGEDPLVFYEFVEILFDKLRELEQTTPLRVDTGLRDLGGVDLKVDIPEITDVKWIYDSGGEDIDEVVKRFMRANATDPEASGNWLLPDKVTPDPGKDRALMISLKEESDPPMSIAPAVYHYVDTPEGPAIWEANIRGERVPIREELIEKWTFLIGSSEDDVFGCFENDFNEDN